MINIEAEIVIPESLTKDQTQAIAKRVRSRVRRMTRRVMLTSRKIVYSNDIKERTGLLRKSIRMKMYQRGFLGSIKPLKLSRMRSFYANFLVSGAKNPKKPKWKLKKRGNFMKQALSRHTLEIEQDFAGIVKEVLSGS